MHLPMLNANGLMWGSDYPHTEGTFPHSREQIAKDFADLPPDVTRKIVRDNAAHLYGIQ
jgi:predicted TIM-barrel fold metal-dependent hydrolase